MLLNMLLSSSSARCEPNMPSTAEIDRAILSAVSARWQKIAMIIVNALGVRHREAIESDYEAVADRVEALIEQGKLQCRGDPKRWRHSEVRIAQCAKERPDTTSSPRRIR